MVGAAVLASVKVRNLKANHNWTCRTGERLKAVLASVKVRNLKANHNEQNAFTRSMWAVLASVKVRNLKANHNRSTIINIWGMGCISKCEGTESES